jgi:hypothetical protein
VPSVTQEPALRFWLHYAAREGALVEEGVDQSLLLLPPSLQDASELPEEVVVTSDPDTAREDGAVLLIAGHPAIERAAGAVLAEGDTGQAYLPWPGSRPPARSTLEARAREMVPVEHGRIDAAGELIAAYVPLLRVGAMVNYAASLALRFQEQEEAWVDGRTGIAASERLLAVVLGRPLLPAPDGHRRTVPADLPLALPAAHDQLERHAATRQASLAVHARRALESELTRADAYYQEALESIERRRATAAPDRVRLLDAQADATRNERDRRHREIEDEFQSRHEIRPFRVHVVHVPAYMLPVDVRRGSRRFPFTVTWLAVADEFAAVRCPACGAHERLIANRDRLGCDSCTPRVSAGRTASVASESSAPPRPSDTAPPEREQGGEGGAGNRPHDETAISGAARDKTSSGDVSRRAGSAARLRESSPRPRARTDSGAARSPKRQIQRSVEQIGRRLADHSAGERTGNNLALAFWQGIAAGNRWPRSKAARDSPLRALYRLYGDAGPLCAIGIPGHLSPIEVTASTYPTQPGFPELTAGTVVAGGEGYRYSMSWWTEAGKAIVAEITPVPESLALPPAYGRTAGAAARLGESAPPPTVELDRVSSAMWRAELGRSGLPFAVRCLATWWRVQKHADPAESHAAVAAAVAGAVARAAQMRRTRAEGAAIYGTDPALVERAAHTLKGDLRLDRARGW